MPFPEESFGAEGRVDASPNRPLQEQSSRCNPRMYGHVIGGLAGFLRAAFAGYSPVALPTESAALPSSVSIVWIARWVVSYERKETIMSTIASDG